MNASEPLAQIASSGILGALVVVLLLVVRHLHNQLTAEKNARIEDGQKTLGVMMSVQKDRVDESHKFGDYVDFLKGQEQRREEEHRQLMAGGRGPYRRGGAGGE